MTEKSPVRTVDDVDQSVLDYAEIKALCVGNHKIKEKMDLEQDLKKLSVLQSQFKMNLYRMETALLKTFPGQIKAKATFGIAFEHWLKHVHRHSIGLSTYDKYSSQHRLYIANSGLSGMRLIDIRSANIQGYYNALLEKTTAKNIHKVDKLLRIFFKYCLKADILIKNPLLAVELPKIPAQSESPNTALTDNDSVKYLNVDGEYRVILSETETASSIRRVPIMAEIQELLHEHINELRKGTNVLSITGDFLLFPSTTGTYREQNNIREAFKRLCRKIGIEKGQTMHSLRHSFCTILARQGVSLLDASRLMGHSNINITAKIYSHVSDDDKKSAVKKLSSYFH